MQKATMQKHQITIRSITATSESSIRVDFVVLSREDDIKTIAVGAAVDDFNYLMQVDKTGKIRTFEFDFLVIEKFIYDCSSINIVIRIVGIDGYVTDCGFARNLAIENGYPYVSNPRITKDEKSGLISIWYDYSSQYEIDPANVDIVLSDDNGKTWLVETTSLIGDVGQGIATGVNRRVTWDPAIDLPNASVVPITALVSITNSDGIEAKGQSRTGTILVTTVKAAKPVITIVSPHEKTRYAKQYGQMFKNEQILLAAFPRL